MLNWCSYIYKLYNKYSQQSLPRLLFVDNYVLANVLRVHYPNFMQSIFYKKKITAVFSICSQQLRLHPAEQSQTQWNEYVLHFVSFFLFWNSLSFHKNNYFLVLVFNSKYLQVGFSQPFICILATCRSSGEAAGSISAKPCVTGCL